MKMKVQPVTFFGNYMIPNSKIVDLVLKEFQEALVNNLDASWQPELGDPPKYGYVEHNEFVEDVTGHCKGKPILLDTEHGFSLINIALFLTK